MSSKKFGAYGDLETVLTGYAAAIAKRLKTVTTLPTPTRAGDVVLYLGSETGYSKGHYYLSKEDSANPGTYIWDDITADTKVMQSNTTANYDYRVLFSKNANDETETSGARKSANMKFNPSTGNLQITKLNGVAVGNDPKFTDTTYTQGTGISISGGAINIAEHAASYVGAGTMAGRVRANGTAAATLGNAQVRDIYAGTADMTEGTTALTTGAVYLQYEA